MKARRIAVFLLLLTLLFSGCSAGNSRSGNMYASVPEASTDKSSAEVGIGGEKGSTSRKIIVTANFQLEAEDFAAASQALLDAVNNGGGYVESMRESGGETNRGDGSYTVRIPVEAMDSFAQELEKIGTVTQRSQNSNDITDAYYDVDARLRAKRTQHARILALMEKAETLSDLLQLEQELASVEAEIDQLAGTQKRYDDQVEYATVTVWLRQTTLSQVGAPSFAYEALNALRDSLSVGVSILRGLAIALIWLAPYLIVAAVVITVVLLATRKKRRARKQAKAALPQPIAPQGVPTAPPLPRTDGNKPE